MRWGVQVPTVAWRSHAVQMRPVAQRAESGRHGRCSSIRPFSWGNVIMLVVCSSPVHKAVDGSHVQAPGQSSSIAHKCSTHTLPRHVPRPHCSSDTHSTHLSLDASHTGACSQAHSSRPFRGAVQDEPVGGKLHSKAHPTEPTTDKHNSIAIPITITCILLPVDSKTFQFFVNADARVCNGIEVCQIGNHPLALQTTVRGLYPFDFDCM